MLKSNAQVVRPNDLPSDVFRSVPVGVPVAVPSNGSGAHRPVVDELAARLLERGESFWTAVYPTFMSRDLTRDDLRKIVQIGLENSNGNYRLVVQLFNMPDADYKRFLSFLRKHDCHLPFQRFRVAPARLSSQPVTAPAVAGLKA